MRDARRADAATLEQAMAKRGFDEASISQAEWEVLSRLWERRRGTAKDLTGDLEPSRGWAYSTVKTMLDRMAAKGLVTARQVGNVWEFSPAVEPAQARRSAWKRFVGAAFSGAVTPALQFVVSDARLTKRQREELLALLQHPAAKENARD
jgi:BlaI family penicillinase repressor